jgi:polysaccharide export outer membrane protein
VNGFSLMLADSGKKGAKMYSLINCKRYFLASLFALLVFGCLLIPVGCISGPQANSTFESVLAKQESVRNNVEQYNQQILNATGRLWQPPEYTINEGDLLLIKVFEAPELSTETRVNDNGVIAMPLIGNIKVKGLILSKAEEIIASAYKVNYLQNPHISVAVKEQQGGRVTVAGAVQKPGAYEYMPQGRVLDALALAGGLSDKAGHTVQVRRNSLESNESENFVIDLDQVINAGKEDLNIKIRRGDTVFVPQAGVVCVDGAVQTPGNYQIKKNMTVREAIMAAGGFHSTADQDRIKLARYSGNGKMEVMQLSAKSVGEDSADSVTIKDRDIIFAESNALASMIYGLQVRLGLVGFGYTPPAR